MLQGTTNTYTNTQGDVVCKKDWIVETPRNTTTGTRPLLHWCFVYRMMVTSCSAAVTLAHNCALSPLIRLWCTVYAYALQWRLAEVLNAPLPNA
jgi:hypothetical protein